PGVAERNDSLVLTHMSAHHYQGIVNIGTKENVAFLLNAGKRGKAVKGSGKEAMLPAPPPLRTGLAPCNASGSSLLERLSRDAVGFCRKLLAVPLPVAVAVEQPQVGHFVPTTVHTPHPMVQLPLLAFLQELAAPRAASL